MIKIELQNFSLKYIPSETIKKIASYVQAMGIFKCDSTYTVKRKKYDSILILVTLSGKGWLKYDSKQYQIVENEGFIIDCNRTQVYYTDKENLWEFIWLHFKDENSKKKVEYILNASGPSFTIDKDDTIKSNMNKLLSMIKNRGFHNDLIISDHINSIMTCIMLKTLPGGTKNKILPEIVNNTIELIEKTYFEEVSIDFLAKRLYIDKYDLIRKFKKHLGMTPYQYLVKYRINQSKILLENSSLSVYEIAAKVGFENSSYFIRVFKSQENTTPLNYRKLWR